MIHHADVIDLSAPTLLARFDPACKLDLFFDLLLEENKRVNLVSRETSRDGLKQLAAESLAAPAFLESSSFANYLDIGSGGGFPAIPIMMAATSVISIDKTTLIERTQKRAAALRRILLKLGLRAEIKVQDFPHHANLSEQQLITLRYVKLTKPLLEAILPMLSAEGRFVYYSQPGFEIDLPGLSAVIQPLTLDGRPHERHLTIIRKTN